MLVDLFPKVKKKYKDLGRRAKGGGSSEMEQLMPTFMSQKDKCQRYLGDIEHNLLLLKDLKEKYKEAMDSKVEAELLEKMNDKNEENSKLLKQTNKLLAKMKGEAKKYKYNEALKDEPEGRIMIGLSNAIQTWVYKILQQSQLMQVEIKSTVKGKISRQMMTADPSLTPDKVAEMIDNPEAVQEVLQGKLFASAHGKVRNAIQDINSKYQELGKLENNVRELFEMIQDLSMIVKNQTEILNSIEENLKGTKNYVEKAVVNLEKAKEEYLSGNEKMCCIAVIVVIIGLLILWPILSIVT